MKKLFLVALLAVGITAVAQEKDQKKVDREKLTSEQKANFQITKMTKDLDLNEKQAKDLKILVAKEIEKRENKKAEMTEKREMNAQNRETAKAEMEKEQTYVNGEMKKILTPEQFAKWEKIRDERKEMMKQRMMQRREKAGSQELPVDKSK